ncbi:hypothetical protein [Lentzea sp. HUAS12]|nr:hypothetical protein [Lentzea sp. HUAS12]
MTDPINPEAPHSPGTPSLDDLDVEIVDEPEIPQETTEDESKPPD